MIGSLGTSLSFSQVCGSRFAPRICGSFSCPNSVRSCRGVRIFCPSSAAAFPRHGFCVTGPQRLWPARQRRRAGRRCFLDIRGVYSNGKNGLKSNAKGKSPDSSLSEDEPLPLPMTWPNSEPDPKEKVEAMLNCDVEVQDCKEVVYQWTGECKACQGTGVVSFYRKRHEVISTCVNCLGLGSVHKITARADIQNMDGLNGSVRRSNGSAGADDEA